MTRLNWNEVFEMPALQFLIYILFYNYSERKKEQQMNNFKRKIK